MSNVPLLLVDVVGLVPSMIGPSTPNLRKLAESGGMARLPCPFPAVTCTSQATLLSGTTPDRHGIVANGWHFRELGETWLWRQSHALMQAEDVHSTLKVRNPDLRVARLFLWYAMGAPCDLVATPRPQYKSDGRKLPDVWTSPPELRDELQSALGTFPLFNFWGPGADLRSSVWIIDAAKRVLESRKADVVSVYVPHLDYDLQRFGPDAPEARRAVTDVDRALGPLFAAAETHGARVAVWSEYGIEHAVGPVHPNRALRAAGLLSVRDEDGELLDPIASEAFAVSDHQVAHVYVRDAASRNRVRDVLRGLEGVERVLEGAELVSEGLGHPRSGEFVLVAAPGRWFTYYPWIDDARAPDFARCVDIHKKPGYDPCELMFDPAHPAPKLGAAWRLLKKTLGFRTTFDLIGLDASIVRGTHGRRSPDTGDGPLLISNVRDPIFDGGPRTVGSFREFVLRTAGVG